MFKKVLFLLCLSLKATLEFLQNTFGLTDWLTFIRHIIVSFYCWIISPKLFNYLSALKAGTIMFIITITITTIFLMISAGKTKKGKLLEIANSIRKKSKFGAFVTLLILEPFLLVVYYRDNHYQYNNTSWQKIEFLLLVVLSSLSASTLWSIFIYFSGLRI